MSTFAPLQQRRSKPISSVRQSATVLRPSRGFETPKVSPVSEPGPPLDRLHTVSFSLAQMPVVSSKENHMGLPDTLKAGIETLSGMSMDDVKVHYHSPKPIQVQALAYTQGANIHVGPSQEKHLPHEAWHVVQQKQRRVKSTLQAKGLAINDDQELEREADAMGERAIQIGAGKVQVGKVHDAGSTVNKSGLVKSMAPSSLHTPIQGVFTYNNKEMNKQDVETIRTELIKKNHMKIGSSQEQQFDKIKASQKEISIEKWMNDVAPEITVSSILKSEAEEENRGFFPKRKLGEATDENIKIKTPKRKVEVANEGWLAEPGSPISTDSAKMPREEVPEKEEEKWSEEKKEQFLKAWSAHLKKLRDEEPEGTAKRKKELKNSTSQERDLSRLAWILEKMDNTRTCVAVLMADKEFLLFANKMDTNLESDMKVIMEALKNEENYTKLLERLAEGAKDEIRNLKALKKNKKKADKKVAEVQARAGRRLSKVKRFLKHCVDTYGSENTSYKEFKSSTEDKHAEMHTADAAAAAKKKAAVKAPLEAETEGSTEAMETETEGSTEAMETEKGGTKAMETENKFYLGISKLCCGKCAMALKALKEVEGINFKVLGQHLATYNTQAGWPIPRFLLNNDQAMEHFLGEEAFEIYQKHKKECKWLIKRNKLAVTAYNKTDNVSSDEEELQENALTK